MVVKIKITQDPGWLPEFLHPLVHYTVSWSQVPLQHQLQNTLYSYIWNTFNYIQLHSTTLHCQLKPSGTPAPASKSFFSATFDYITMLAKAKRRSSISYKMLYSATFKTYIQTYNTYNYIQTVPLAGPLACPNSSLVLSSKFLSSSVLDFQQPSTFHRRGLKINFSQELFFDYFWGYGDMKNVYWIWIPSSSSSSSSSRSSSLNSSSRWLV